MSKNEEYKKIKELRDDLEPIFENFENKVRDYLEGKHKMLDAEWVKYQALGDPRAIKIEEKMETVKRQKDEVQETLRKLKKQISRYTQNFSI